MRMYSSKAYGIGAVASRWSYNRQETEIGGREIDIRDRREEIEKKMLLPLLNQDDKM